MDAVRSFKDTLGLEDKARRHPGDSHGADFDSTQPRSLQTTFVFVNTHRVPLSHCVAQDAAQVHMEIGRRMFRGRMEVGDKEGESAQRKEFQKLVFLSTLVFGEAKARFLLPWKRVFQVRPLPRCELASSTLSPSPPPPAPPQLTSPLSQRSTLLPFVQAPSPFSPASSPPSFRSARSPTPR